MHQSATVLACCISGTAATGWPEIIYKDTTELAARSPCTIITGIFHSHHFVQFVEDPQLTLELGAAEVQLLIDRDVE